MELSERFSIGAVSKNKNKKAAPIQRGLSLYFKPDS